MPRPEIYELAKHLPSDYGITILQPKNSFNEKRDIQITPNIVVKYIPAAFLHLQNSVVPLVNLRVFINQICRLVDENKCDILQICDYEYLTAILPFFIRRIRPQVRSVIVNDALIGVGGYSFGSNWLNVFSKLYTLQIGKRFLGKYDAIVMLYSGIIEETKKIGVDQTRLLVIPYGLDFPVLSKSNPALHELKKKFGILDDEKVILYVGRLVQMKRVELVLSTTAQLLKEGFKVKALIVGDGPQRNNLEELAQSIRQNVIFTGFLSKDLSVCYQIADLLILPSISEGLPAVLMEAASFGVPVVATNTNGIPDIVIHGRTGFLVNKTRVEDYFYFSKLILFDKNLAKKMSENAQNHVNQFFSWQKIAEKYVALYNALLKGQPIY
jgi:glycosyltransferase involved in cell wall biosynthesis